MEDCVEDDEGRRRQNTSVYFLIEPIIPVFQYSITPIVSRAN